VLETVGFDGERPMGVPFLELSPEHVRQAVYSFLDRQAEFPVDSCIERSRKFSVEKFTESFLRVVDGVMQNGRADGQKTVG
jgi:hypothetical protein